MYATGLCKVHFAQLSHHARISCDESTTKTDKKPGKRGAGVRGNGKYDADLWISSNLSGVSPTVFVKIGVDNPLRRAYTKDSFENETQNR